MSDRPDDTEFEAKLWRSAHDERPSAKVREDVLAAALAAGLTPGGGGSGSGGGGTGTSAALGWKVAGALALVAGAAAIFIATRPSERPAVATPASVISAPAPSATVVEAPAPEPPAAEPAAPPVKVIPAPAPPAASAPSPRALTLADEILAIDAARAALARDDAPAALRSLDAYDKSFPHGTLAPEAASLRARAAARIRKEK